MLEPTSLLMGGAALGFLAGFWRKLQSVLHKFVSIFIVTNDLEFFTYNMIFLYLRDNWKRISVSDVNYGSQWNHVRSVSRYMPVTYENPPKDMTFFRKKHSLIGISGGREGTENYNDPVYKIRYLRWSVDIKDLIVNSNEYYADLCKNEDNRFKVKRFVGIGRNESIRLSKNDKPSSYCDDSESDKQETRKYIGWDREDIGELTNTTEDPLNQMYLSDEAIECVEELKRWYKAESWYKERNITHKRGILLHGVPGSGKTMLAKSLAQHLKIPLCVFDISSLSNSELYESWKEMQEMAPCVALIEDMDAVFNLRENLIKNSELTFDCLLNCIGGVESSHGVLTIITTNHIDKIDPAIGVFSDGEPSRPGRVDRVVLMGKTDRAGRFAIAQHILKGYNHLIEKVVNENTDVTGAQMENICVKLALKEFWGNKH